MYRTQREAIADARIAMWGEGRLTQRPFLHLEVQNPLWLLGTWVTAEVNGRDIVFRFDNYGRHDRLEVLPRR
jgi:hypothetical protein